MYIKLLSVDDFKEMVRNNFNSTNIFTKFILFISLVFAFINMFVDINQYLYNTPIRMTKFESIFYICSLQSFLILICVQFSILIYDCIFTFFTIFLLKRKINWNCKNVFGFLSQKFNHSNFIQLICSFYSFYRFRLDLLFK